MVPTMDPVEVFPNAPLALAAAQVLYAQVEDRALSSAGQRYFQDHLGPDWVIPPDANEMLGFDSGFPDQHSISRLEDVWRITSRQRTSTITVRSSGFIVEVTDYKGFDSFRTVLQEASNAVSAVLQPEGIVSIGLRYVNEVSVPHTTSDWDHWLHHSLMAPALPSELTPNDWTGTVEYPLARDQVLVFRYGPSDGPVISTSGVLRRPRVPEGPVFVLDFDSSWQPNHIPQFSTPMIIKVANRLHSPIRSLFNSLLQPPILPLLRQEPF